MTRDRAFPSRLRAIMDARDLNQSDIARMVFGTTTNEKGNVVARNRSQVSRWMQGSTLPDDRSLRKLAEALEIPREELLPKKAPPPDATVEMRDLGEGRAHLRVDKVVPLAVAAKIVSMLAGVSDA